MGNLYTDNLIGTVIGLSVADDWEGARREWRIVGCEVDETHSATCVCGKEGLRYVYTIANTETGETLSLSSQLMGTRGGGTSGSWFPGEPETPQKRHGKGCGGTPFSMPFLLSH